MKVKMFSTILYGKLKTFAMKLKEPLHSEIEKEIQEWLDKEKNIKIHDIKQSMSGGSISPPKLIITIFYE